MNEWPLESASKASDGRLTFQIICDLAYMLNFVDHLAGDATYAE